MAAENQEQRAALVMLLRAHGIRDLRVLNAFERMPRQNFISGEFAEAASRDSPLPLPCGQTMERPSEAAQMIEAMHVEAGHHVLEIGAGSGWLTGVLSQLAGHVTAYERYAELAQAASENLKKLGVENVKLMQGDGMLINGNTKFDRIFLSVSVEDMPTGLTALLKDQGQLFAAIGRAEGKQQFTCFSKSAERVRARPLFPARLPPMISGAAQAL
jgi:protein-L-isoaspartate(D-aspartate) O-methyltransferase